MIENASIALQPHEAAPRRKEQPLRAEAPGFSYALAASALERKAAQSLETHGATPKNNGASPQRTAAETQTENRSQSGEIKSDAQRESVQPPSAGAEKSASPQVRPTIGALSASAEGAAPAAATAALFNQVSLTQTKAADAAMVRDAGAAKAKLSAQKAPRLPDAPATLKTEFAEILARRLEKTSVFELRLDPPELGRVDGRLSVGDDGKAVLALSFDNQSAFDLFSRDEQALRQALQQAGLEFGAGDFVFAFKERPPADHTSVDLMNAPAIRAADAYEPTFHAEWSAGALDIRI